MFTSLSVSHYRRLKSLRINRLSRVNLITGANNTGKTSVLEAVFLLAHGGNAAAAINSHVVRGGIGKGVAADANAWALWAPLFSHLDVSTPISISAREGGLGNLHLRISHHYSGTVATVTRGRESASRPPGPPELAFELKQSQASGGRRPTRVRSRIRFEAAGPQVSSMVRKPIVVPCTLLSVGAQDDDDDAERLGRMRQTKQDDFIVAPLQIIEPRLKRIEVIPGPPGGHLLWGDVGGVELLPLAVLGDGLKRLARLLLAMGHQRNHVVLVDEIETGYHYSILDKVWSVIHTAARTFDVQVIATTHSYSCVAAAQRTSDGREFGLHRLEVDGDAARCVTFDSESIGGAIKHNLEVR